MIKARIYIRRYRWKVTVYMAVHCYHTSEILSDMLFLGADDEYLDGAYRSMRSGRLDTGLCYSNCDRRESVIVTSLTSSAAEFFNSIVHEIGHLSTHISEECGIDLTGEEKCYLEGDFAMQLYPYCKELLCCHCHGRS